MLQPMSKARPTLTPPQVRAMLHRGLLLEYVSTAWMTVESIVSVFAGLLAGSMALVAFGGDSFIELVSALVVAAYLRKERAGTANSQVLERTERFTGILLVLLIPVIGLGTVYAVLTGARAESSTPGILVAVAAVILMPILWLQKSKIGDLTGCKPLSNDAVESATCFFMSITLLGGLLTVSLFGLWWVDYLATVVILAFVGKEAAEAFSEEP